MKHTIEEYRNGGEGFALWAEDNCCISIFPKGARVPVWMSLGSLPEETTDWFD